MTFGDRARRALAPRALAAMAAIPAGCGSDDEDKGGAAAKRLTVEETEASKGRYALKAPRSVEAELVEIRFTNNAKLPADAALFRVAGEHSAREVIAKVVDSPDGAPTPDRAHSAGGVGRIAPGKTGTAGAPKEYRFKALGLKAGTNRLAFANAGREAHHVVAFPFRKGATLDQVKQSFMSEGPPKGPPPINEERGQGTSVTEGGTKIVTALKLAQGKYALVCFISDRKGGPPHVAKGMIVEATVSGS